MYLINKGKNSSGRDNLNILFKEKNVYIMDNHLAAIWCWYNILNLSNKYSFFHIDRHYDLGVNLVEEGAKHIKNKQINIAKLLPENLSDHKVLVQNLIEVPIFVWDNYINLFNKLNPKVINETIFATQHSGTFNYKTKNVIHKESCEIQNNLGYWLDEKDKGAKKWIVNLDIDYFFTKYDCKDEDCTQDEYIYQHLTDEFISILCSELKSKLDKTIAVLTIAMSPECCGGWDKSIRITNLVAAELGIKFKYK